MLNKIRFIFQDSDFSEIISKAGFFLFFRTLAFLFGYLFAILVIKYYGVNVYGFVTLSFTIIMISSVLCRFGFDISLTKVFGIENNSNSFNHYTFSVLSSIFLSLIFSATLFFLSTEISTLIFSKEEFDIYLKWTALSIPLWTLLLLNTGVFRGLAKVQYYATLDNFGRFLLSIVVLGFFLVLNDNNNNYEPIIAHTIGLFLLLIISFFWINKVLVSDQKISLKKSKKFIQNSFPIMLTSSIVIFLAWSDKILLGIFNTEKNLAIYDISMRIATLLTFNLEGINSILSSKISKFYSEKKMIELNRVIQFSSKINIITAIIIFLTIFIFSNSILRFFGNEFLEGQSVLFILLIGQLCNSYCGPVGNIMLMTGNQVPFRNILAGALILNLVLNFFLIPKFGIIGASIATSLSLIFWNFFGAYYLRKNLQLNSFYWPNLNKKSI